MIPLPVKPLREALTGFRKLTLRKDSLPILLHARVLSRPGSLTISATDLDQTLEYTLPADDSLPEADLLVPLDLLGGCLKTLRAASSALTLNPGDSTLLVNDGRATVPVSFTAGKLKEYPADPAAPEQPLTKLPAGAVRHLCEASSCASTDQTRYILNSVLLEPDGVVATDGRQLYHANSLDLSLEKPVIVPSAKALHVFDHEHEADLSIRKHGEQTYYTLSQENRRWSFRSIEGTYPNWRQVRPRDQEQQARVLLSDADVGLLRDTLGRLPGSKGSSVSLVVGKGRARFVTRHNGGEQIHDLTPEKIEGRGHVHFNFDMLLDSLALGLRDLRLFGPISPMIARDISRTHLFMPSRVADASDEWVERIENQTQAEQKGEGDTSETSTDAQLDTPTPKQTSAPESPTPPATSPSTSPQPEAPTTTPEPQAQTPRTMKAKHTPDTKTEPTAAETSPASARLVEALGELRESLKDTATRVTALMPLAREAAREHTGLDREYQSLKRSIRSLRKLEV